MKQVAKRAGVIGRRLYEPGEQFEHAERMNWADLVPEPKPEKKPVKVKADDPPTEDLI